jgi:hypothetical protein
MTILKELRTSIKNVGLRLYISAFILVFISGFIFAASFSDLLIQQLLSDLKFITTFESLKYVYGPVIGVLLAFFINFLKEKSDEKKEGKKELDKLMLMLSMFINNLIVLKESVRKEENKPIRFIAIKQYMNFSISDELISANTLSTLLKNVDSTLSQDILVSQDSYIAFAKAWAFRDKLYEKTMEIYTSKIDEDMISASLLELRNNIGGYHTFMLYDSTETGIILLDSALTKLNDSFNSVAKYYQKFGFGNLNLTISDEFKSSLDAFTPPQIESSEHLQEILDEQRQQVINENISNF